ncbi:MAG: hypothetical protein WAW90_00910 [Minisyncoccia bacterium]
MVRRPNKHLKKLFGKMEKKNLLHGALVGSIAVALIYLLVFSSLAVTEYRSAAADAVEIFIPLPTLDKADYDTRLLALAHVTVSTTTASSTSRLWPVKTDYPKVGAILPFKRIVAYYGNFYSKGMGVLGEYPADQLISMLASTTARWTAADPNTPAIPAIQYIAVVAQASAGKEGKYILRMPDDQIDHALEMAERAHGILFLDVQVGKSTVEHEIPQLEKYLKMPQVHLAIDPEFSMKNGEAPGRVIGTSDAADINYVAQYLAGLVNTYHLPPKVLVVHRFTKGMITNYKQIKTLPEVQIVIDMDGWGPQDKKKGTYSHVIYPEPIQFTGMKLFYKNDIKPPSTGLLTTDEVLKLTPTPVYIQYQ